MKKLLIVFAVLMAFAAGQSLQNGWTYEMYKPNSRFRSDGNTYVQNTGIITDQLTGCQYLVLTTLGGQWNTVMTLMPDTCKPKSQWQGQ